MELAIAGIVFGLVLVGGIWFVVRGFLREGASGRNIEARLDEKTNLILSQLNERLNENRESIERTSGRMSQHISLFSENLAAVKERLGFMSDSVKEISSFQDIFRSPKLRGQWGEAALAHLLSQYFSRDLYELQHHFRSVNDTVDAVLKLPDGRLLPIDSKFSYENFESDKKLFLADVKKQIDDIAAKYILPAEGTVDMALMYIPAETMYYELINHLQEEFNALSYAWSKKVILVSPNTFYLTVRVVQHWYKDVQVSKETKDILKRLGRITQDAGKLQESFSKLGKHLRDARSAYDDSEKRVGLLGDRVMSLTQGAEEEQEEKSVLPL